MFYVSHETHQKYQTRQALFKIFTLFQKESSYKSKDSKTCVNAKLESRFEA